MLDCGFRDELLHFLALFANRRVEDFLFDRGMNSQLATNELGEPRLLRCLGFFLFRFVLVEQRVHFLMIFLEHFDCVVFRLADAEHGVLAWKQRMARPTMADYGFASYRRSTESIVRLRLQEGRAALGTAPLSCARGNVGAD